MPYRPRYCGLLLGVAAWMLVVGGLDLGAQFRRRREPPLPPPATLLLPPQTLWAADLPAAPAAPAVAVGDTVVIPLTTGTLQAVDWATGMLRWTQPHQTSLPPVAGGAHVVAATPTSLDAFDAASGAAVWSLPLVSPPVAIVGTDRAAYVLDAGTVTAVDASTGRVRWAHVVESPPTLLAAGAPGVAVTLSDARVVVLSNEDGRLLWSRGLEGQLTGAAWSGAVLVVGSSARAAWGLDAGNGDVKWRWPLGGSVVAVTADPERAFLATRDNLLRAVNRGNGHQRWQADVGTRAQDAVALDGAVLVLGLTPTLSLYNSLTGMALGTFEAPGTVLGTPLVDRSLRPGGVALVVLVRDGRLFGLRSYLLTFPELPVTALLGLPGRTVPRERLPVAGR